MATAAGLALALVAGLLPPGAMPASAVSDEALLIAESNGTVEPLTAVEVGDVGGEPSDFVEFDGRVVFAVGHDLWISDGTAEGTSELPSPDRIDLEVSAVAGDRLYFRAGALDGLTTRWEVWATDGTPADTEPVVDRDVLGAAAFSEMEAFGERVAVRAQIDQDPRVFLLDEDSPGGAELIVDEQLWTGDVPARLGALDDALFFTTRVGNVRKLYRVDQAGTPTLIWEVGDDAGDGASGPTRLTPAGGLLFFQADVSSTTTDRRLGVTDGTEAGTKLLTEQGDIDNLEELTAVGDRVFFYSGPQLWVSDGTPEGTTKYWADGLDEANLPELLTAAGNRLVFVAPRNSDPESWWTTDGTEAGTEPLTVDDEPVTAWIDDSVSTGDHAWLGNLNGLVRTDGTSAGTTFSDPDPLRVREMGPVGDVLAMTAHEGSPSADSALWRVDGEAPTWPGSAELRALSVGATYAELEWDAATHADGVSAYRVVAGGDVLARVDGDTTGIVLDGLETGEAYQLAVEALAGFGAVAAGPTREITTGEEDEPGTAPLTLTAGPGEVELSWPSLDEADSYRVYRAEGDEELAEIVDDVTGTAYIDEGPDAETTYRYEVRAVVDGGEENHTVQAEVTTLPIAVEAPTALPGSYARDGAPHVAALDSDLAITAAGDPHRTATATVSYIDTEGDDQIAQAGLDEAFAGTYQGQFALAEGVASVQTVEAVLCDGAGSCAEAATDTGLTVGGAVEVELDVPAALDGGRLSVLSDTAGGDVATVDAEGTARVNRLVPADDYRVRVTDQDGRTVADAEDVEVEPGAVGHLDLEAVLFAGLPVRVEYPSGDPVERARVTLRDSEGATAASGWTDLDGKWLFNAVPEGTYDLTIIDGTRAERARGEHTVPVTIDASDDRTEVVVLPDLPGGTVVGTVTGGDGEPAAWAVVTITQTVDGHRWTFRGTADADGEFSVQAVAGDARVTASAGATSGWADVAVPEDGTVTADVAFPEIDDFDLEIRLFTQFAGESRVGPLDLHLDTRRQPSVTVDGAKVFSPFQRLHTEPGQSVEVCADGSTLGLSSECVEVSEPGVVEVTASQEAAVQGRVVGPDGSPQTTYLAHLFRVEDDGSLTHLGHFGGIDADLNLGVPGAGHYELRIAAGAGVEKMASRPIRTIVDEGQAVDVGTIELHSPGRFGDSRVYASVSEAGPGELVTLTTELRNSADTGIQDVGLLLDVPDGASLADSGLSVDGQTTPDEVLRRAGGAQLLPLGDLDGGGERTVRHVVRIDDDAPAGQALDMGVRVRFAHQGAEHDNTVGTHRVTVSGVTVEGPRTTATHDVRLYGRASAGETVRLYDRDALIGETEAGAGGFWETAAELVDRGDNYRHRVQARAGSDESRRSTDLLIHYDRSAPTPTVAYFQASGGLRSWDPATGVQRFIQAFWTPPKVEVGVTFDDPSRVVDPVAVVGLTREPMELVDGVYQAELSPRLEQLGAFGVDFDVAPAPIDVEEEMAWRAEDGVVRNRLPREFEDIEVEEVTRLGGASGASFDAQGTDGFGDEDELLEGSGDDVRDYDIEDEDYDEGVRVEKTTSRWGLSIATTVTVREEDYTPTQADLNFEARTGLPVYDSSVSWSLTPSRFRLVGSAKIPLDELPEDEDIETAAAELLAASLAAETDGLNVSAGDVEITSAMWEGEEPEFRFASRQRVAQVAYQVVSAGATVSDALGALSGADRYEELGDMLDDAMERCTSPELRDVLKDQIDQAAKEAAVMQVASVGMMAAGTAAAAMTGGLGGIAILGITAYLDHGVDAALDRRMDLIKEAMDNDPDCQAEDPDDPDVDVKLAQPRWLRPWDPAGYVFEAVESNRLEGATVTVFEGYPYGPEEDPESWMVWDAEPFLQENPLITGVDGRYAWDVPEGWWHTRAVLDDYEPVTSEVLRVLPEHFDVHLGMVSLSDPTVASVEAWAAGEAGPDEVVVGFDHWMRTPDMAGRIVVTDGDGEELGGTVEPVDPQPHSTGRMSDESKALVAPEGEELAEAFAFRPDAGWEAGDELTVTVDGLAQGYHLKVLGEDDERTVEVTARPPTPAIDRVEWVSDGALRGMELDGRIVDGDPSDVVAITARLVTDGGGVLAEVEWIGGALGDATFTAPFDIDGWGSFDYADDGRWHLVEQLVPFTYAGTAGAVIEVEFADGRTETATSSALSGDRSSVAPPAVDLGEPEERGDSGDRDEPDDSGDPGEPDDPGGPGEPGDPTDPEEPDDGHDDLTDEPEEELVDVELLRIAGRDRVATAIETSRARFADAGDPGDGRSQAGAVIITRSDEFVDALAGTPLSVERDAPMLLTPTAELDERVVAEIDRVLGGSGSVILLGGNAAVAADVEQELEGLGYTTTRFAGATRYETAVSIAADGLASPQDVLLATGHDFPDALAAGNAAALRGGAVLLTNDDQLPSATEAHLTAHSAEDSYAIGGPAARALPEATALVGVNRYETAISVARHFSPSATSVGIATGQQFPDALTGGAHAASLDAPILLTGSDLLPNQVSSYLESQSEQVATAVIYGGEAAVSVSVSDALLAALNPPGSASRGRGAAELSADDHLEPTVSPHSSSEALLRWMTGAWRPTGPRR